MFHLCPAKDLWRHNDRFGKLQPDPNFEVLLAAIRLARESGLNGLNLLVPLPEFRPQHHFR